MIGNLFEFLDQRAKEWQFVAIFLKLGRIQDSVDHPHALQQLFSQFLTVCELQPMNEIAKHGANVPAGFRNYLETLTNQQIGDPLLDLDQAGNLRLNRFHNLKHIIEYFIS